MKNVSAILLCLFVHNIYSAVECNTQKRHESYRSENARECEHDQTRLKCLDVKEITDGDTLIINISGVHPYFGENASVRLLGLDTPESRPPSVDCVKLSPRDSEADHEEYKLCLEAKRLRKCELDASVEATSLLVKAICEDSDRVDIELAKDDNGELIREKYGRILGDILILKKLGSRHTTINASELLLKSKLAFEYDGGTKTTRDWCSKSPVKETKLQTTYVKENFCSSRKCTEKTRQVRCFRRANFNEQMTCYTDRIESSIGRWFQSCNSKSGAKRRSCFREKGESYHEFCDLYKSSTDIKACHIEMGKAMTSYCSTLSSDAQNDCEISISH